MLSWASGKWNPWMLLLNKILRKNIVRKVVKNILIVKQFVSKEAGPSQFFCVRKIKREICVLLVNLFFVVSVKMSKVQCFLVVSIKAMKNTERMMILACYKENLKVRENFPRKHHEKPTSFTWECLTALEYGGFLWPVTFHALFIWSPVQSVDCGEAFHFEVALFKVLWFHLQPKWIN